MPATACPVGVCRWATWNGRPRKIEDCNNSVQAFCPQSSKPHFYQGTYYRYPQKFASRQHCVNVWNRWLSEHGLKNEYSLAES